jgi:hypothetical protein
MTPSLSETTDFEDALNYYSGLVEISKTNVILTKRLDEAKAEVLNTYRALSQRLDKCFEDADIALETARKEERERCAKVCDHIHDMTLDYHQRESIKECAAAIRAGK